MKSFTDLVREYSAWKLAEKGNGKLTRTELSNLRENYKKMAGPTKPSNALQERVEAYRKWKLEEKGTDKITKAEFEKIKESLKPAQKGNDWETYLKSYKHFKESQEGKGAKITYKELKMLKENFKEAETKGIKLREADMGGAMAGGDPNQALDPAAGGGDPNAAMGTDPNAAQPAGGQSAAEIATAIISALTPIAGGDGTDPLAGGDPMAGNPAADIPADPNAAPGADANPGMGAPLQQSNKSTDGKQIREMLQQYSAWKKENKGTAKLTEGEIEAIKKQFAAQPKSKYQQIKERIAARQAQIEGLKEGYLDIPTTSELGTLTSKAHVSNSSGGGDKSTDASPYASIPSPQALANGYTSGKGAGETKAAKTWPTKAMGKEAGGALQGKGATQTGTKVKESDNADDPENKDILNEQSIKTVTDVYVERHLEPKLDFFKLKEAMSKGLLG